ncbi:MAG TPA: phosphatase PAP2 family protein [Puia sp.]|nr:phosphatase PAP2 family protein [Puia sp.]
MPLLKWLDHLDRSMFRLVQHGSSPFLDWLIPPLRDPYIWIPLYAFLLYYCFRAAGESVAGSAGLQDKHRRSSIRIALIFIVLSVATVALTDSVTAQLMKPLFGRLRPCHDPEMQPLLRNLVGCGGLYSMPSNHAANHFGLAAFWYFSIRSMNGRKWVWLWFWATVVCYAQVYVGKHYPFDVLAGAVFGTLTGWCASRSFVYWKSKRDPRPGGSSS